MRERGISFPHKRGLNNYYLWGTDARLDILSKEFRDDALGWDNIDRTDREYVSA